MEQLISSFGPGLGILVLAIVCLAFFEHAADRYSGEKFLTSGKLLVLSSIAALYHGALYIERETGWFAGTPWMRWAMIASAGAVALALVVYSFRKSGLLWTVAGTVIQSALLYWTGPLLAVMLPAIVFYRMFKDFRGRPIAGPPSSSQTTVYINQSTY